uniref:Ig-like domain-containing protein n=1 Tax=Poecilia reticulata TaxID=8081 RepID=A0A3P9NQ14_POERE
PIFSAAGHVGNTVLPPISFKKELESQEAREGGETTLSCETSSPDCKVTWWKGSTVLSQGEKYTIQQRAITHSLVIHKLVKEDSGEYTCDTGDKKSTARLTIKGNSFTSTSVLIVYCLSAELFCQQQPLKKSPRFGRTPKQIFCRFYKMYSLFNKSFMYLNFTAFLVKNIF